MRLRNRKYIAVLHRELSFRGDEGDRRVSDWVSRGWTGTTNAADRIPQLGKNKTAVQPWHCWSIRVSPLDSQHRCQTLVEYSRTACHSSSCREDQWCKWCVLYFQDSPLIGILLLSLMFPVSVGERAVTVRGCVGIEDSHITKSSFVSSPPKAIYSGVQPSSILGVGGT